MAGRKLLGHDITSHHVDALRQPGFIDARPGMQGQSTKEMAVAMHVSPYTVQDHLKSIFEKTGVRSRKELVGQIFLEHYATRWEDAADAPSGWSAMAIPETVPGEKPRTTMAKLST